MRKLFGPSITAFAAAVMLAVMFIGCDKKEPTPSGGNGGNDGPKTVAVTGVNYQPDRGRNRDPDGDRVAG